MRNDEYINIKKRDFWICFLLSLFALAYFYPDIIRFFASESSPYYNDSFRIIIDHNLNYIYSTIDVLILFVVCIIIPLVSYIAYIIVSLVRWVWDNITNEIVKEYFYRFRVNFIIFSVILSIICLATGESFFNLLGVILGVVGLVLFNLFTTRIEIEKKAVKTDTTLLVAIIITGVLLVFGYQIEPVRESLTEAYNIVQNDIWFSLFLSLTIMFSIAWPILTRISMIFVHGIIKYRERLNIIVKGLILIVFIYFFAKVAIFNINAYAPEPYPTFMSAMISIITSLLTRYSSKIGDGFRIIGNKVKGVVD